MPTHRWKHAAVFCPSSRCIFTFFTRSSADWWMWVNRFTRLPVYGEMAVIRSSYSACCARSYVIRTLFKLGRRIGSSTGRSTFFPNMYTCTFIFPMLSMYSSPVISAMIFHPFKRKLDLRSMLTAGPEP